MKTALDCVVSWHPQFLLFTNEAPKLLYYAHIPTAIISLIVGFFVFYKSKQSLTGSLLLLISIFFSIWSAINLLVWVGDSSRLMFFLWSYFGLLSGLICILALYFVYAFIDKKDISFSKKIIFSILLLPLFLITPTKYNLIGFSVATCGAIENSYFTNYYYSIGFFVFFWILFLAINRYRKADHDFKKQIIFLTVGMELFLFSFFVTGFLASYFNSILGTDFSLEFYGLFGMTFFMAILAYMIVKYRAFNIKMMAVQVLVVSMLILIGSQYFFIASFTNKILTGITLLLSAIGGYMLIRSVKKEVRKSEELELANIEINKRKEQLQRISDSLAVSNDRLKQLDTAKTEFISMASHQLRTPVTGIKGYLSMLLENSYGEVTAEQRVALQKTYDSNERMVNLIEDLLNVSRIESGRLEYEFTDVKVEDICQDVVNTLYPKSKDRGLYLDYKKPEVELPELWIDRGKVREVISNLVDNALKYTSRGGVTLTVGICDRKEANCLAMPHIRITVSDTGIGIPAEEIPYLFNKFSRGKDISRLNASGTGLGLFVGRKMVEGNNGKIWIESGGADKGSRFIVELPIGKKDGSA